MTRKESIILHTDWSKLGIGAVLGQVDDDGNKYMVACISRAVQTRGKLCILPRRCWQLYGQSRRSALTYMDKFKFVTDHQPLAWLMTKQDPDLVHQYHHARKDTIASLPLNGNRAYVCGSERVWVSVGPAQQSCKSSAS